MKTHGTAQTDAGLGVSTEMPPIYYHGGGDGCSVGEPRDCPDLSKASARRLKGKLLSEMTEQQAEFIQTQKGKEQVREALNAAADDVIHINTGPFTSGSDYRKDMARAWTDFAWQVYKNAALEVRRRSLPVPGADGGNRSAITAAGFGGGSSMLYLVAGLGILSAGGYAYLQTQE